ncbi:multidrug DMT transporter permease [Clostridia bacterium]|nr:multidrug DMT transporter permease [Clostridia bacterium]GHU67549.1 multidrug DMT transporter permease [Clostridia bacterium]
MWLTFAFGAAIFAGITSILAKIGIKDTDSDLATALRTVVVVIFAWLMVFLVGSQTSIADVSQKSFVFLILSGLATGGSWLCYFKAIKLGDINKVVPVDKSSVVLTMLLAFLLLGETLTLLKVVCMVLIGAGTLMMTLPRHLNTGCRAGVIEPKRDGRRTDGSKAWLPFAVLSAIFAALTAILGKIGIADVESNLGTAIRTVVVLIMAWLIVMGKGAHKGIPAIGKKNLLFIALSGLATGLSWICYYRALQTGPVAIVVPIDKLSIVITVAFGCLFLKEKLTKKSGLGLTLIAAGTLCLLIP